MALYYCDERKAEPHIMLEIERAMMSGAVIPCIDCRHHELHQCANYTLRYEGYIYHDKTKSA